MNIIHAKDYCENDVVLFYDKRGLKSNYFERITSCVIPLLYKLDCLKCNNNITFRFLTSAVLFIKVKIHINETKQSNNNNYNNKKEYPHFNYGSEDIWKKKNVLWCRPVFCKRALKKRDLLHMYLNGFNKRLVFTITHCLESVYVVQSVIRMRCKIVRQLYNNFYFFLFSFFSLY